MRVQVLLLANSKKLGGRCLAGLRTDNWTWFRPVSSNNHGSIATKECIFAAGVLRPLDIITCVVKKATPLMHQSENFEIAEGSIELVSHVTEQEVASRLAKITEQKPYFLKSPNPAILPTFFSRSSVPQNSLALIKIDSAVIDETRHVGFNYENQNWTLKLTDEHFKTEGPATKIGKSYICISIGEFWEAKNAHWKLLAGIIPILEPKKSEQSSFLASGTVAEICQKMFSFKPVLHASRFKSAEWFYQTHNSVECPKCRLQTLYSLRKHYQNSRDMVAHYWAIVCYTCRNSKELANFDEDFGKEFKKKTQEAVPIKTICPTCLEHQ